MLLHMEGMQLYQLAGSHWCLVNKCKIVNIEMQPVCNNATILHRKNIRTLFSE
jgi:hypothetical protein